MASTPPRIPELSLPIDVRSRDPLTHLLTRPAFLAALRERIASAAHNGEALALHLLDVDALRSVNDRHGLDAGDDVLRGCADRVRQELASARWRHLEPLLGRYDGDAFALLASVSPSATSVELADALRTIVSRAPFACVRVTASVGVAEHRIGESADELVARAERALHVAKQFGGDCVEASFRPTADARRAPVVALRAR